MGPSPVGKGERPAQQGGRGFRSDPGANHQTITTQCSLLPRGEGGGRGRSTLEHSGLLNIAPPLPAPGSGQEHSPPPAPLSHPSPGPVQYAFSCFSSPLFHPHPVVMVQILYQSLNWSPKSSVTPATPPTPVVSLPFSDSFRGFPLGEGQKPVPRTRAKPLGMAYQALSPKLTLAPSTASFPAISLVPPDLCTCWSFCQK